MVEATCAPIWGGLEGTGVPLQTVATTPPPYLPSAGGQYRYTQDLLALEAIPSQPLAHGFSVAGVLPTGKWNPYLSCHPDQVFANYLRRGLAQGFKIGFDRSHPLGRSEDNYVSATRRPTHVIKYIEGEAAAGRLRLVHPSTKVHTSPVGLVPKDHMPDRFRLIINLSAPEGASVNDGIADSLTSLQYSHVADAVVLIKSAGAGALMAKLDLKSAYRHVPVHPDDQALLAVRWQGHTFVDTALPFGLCSAPKIFTALADGLAWGMACEGISSFIHYLDDFFFCAPALSQECHRALSLAVPLCESLGFPVSPDKVVGPSTIITFLGIELDSVAMEMRLPPVKVDRLKLTLASWRVRHAATKRQLQSIIGQLADASAVVPQGRSFLRALIETMKIPKLPDHFVRLNLECRADLIWWSEFIQRWNGVAFFPGRPVQKVVTSDASGSWGCGAYVEDGGVVEWLQLAWPPSWQNANIAAKELLPIVLSLALWGSRWSGSRVLFRTDNQAVVAALTSFSARDPTMSHLLRCLFFFDVEHKVVHLPGRDNALADAISRNKVDQFFSLCPQASPIPKAIPTSAVSLIMDTSLTWTSPRWSDLLNNTLQGDWHQRQEMHMQLPRGDI